MSQVDNLPTRGSVWGVPGNDPVAWRRVRSVDNVSVEFRDFAGVIDDVPHGLWNQWVIEGDAVDITALLEGKHEA